MPTARSSLLLMALLLGLVACGGPGSASMRPGSATYGKASWYGGKFHGRKTASGERFDKWAMTAAHRTLPFQSVVRVTNLSNGRSVQLRITDRGPFGRRERIIDVSEGAAERLGMKQAGVVKIRLEVLELGPERTKRRRR